MLSSKKVLIRVNVICKETAEYAVCRVSLYMNHRHEIGSKFTQ